MRVRSTGLGNAVMVAQIAKTEIKEGHLIMILESSEPVVWKIRIALNYKDILNVVKVGIFSILGYLVVGLKTLFVETPPPKEF